MTTELPDDVVATVHRIARRATRTRPDNRDDAAQEGLTAAWLAGEDASPGFRVRAAQLAILSFVEGRPSVLARGEGRRYEPTDLEHLDATTPRRDDLEGRLRAKRRDAATSVPDHAETVALHADIADALAALPVSELELAEAVLRHGSPTAAAEALGMKPNTARAAWARRIRPQLADHLKEYAA